MHILPFLFNRELGKIKRNSLRPGADYRLDLDSLVSKFVCLQKDSFLSENLEVPPFCCKFSRKRDVLAVADEDGYVLLYDTYGDNRHLLKTFQCHTNAIFDVCWLPDENHLVTGSGDHSICLWDINAFKRIFSLRNHTASVKSVDVCNNELDMFASGSRDGSICVWDRRAKGNKPSIHIESAHTRIQSSGKKRSSSSSWSSSSVSSVAFQDRNNLASAGASDSMIKMWDLRRTYIMKSGRLPMPRHQIQYSSEKDKTHGCTSLAFDSSFKKLYASCTDNKIHTLDCHSYSLTDKIYEGFQCNTYFVKLALSCDDQYLLSGSSDKKAYMWNVTKPGLPIVELPGHNAEVTSVAWSSNCLTKLVTSGDDSKVLVWQIENSEKFVERDIFSSAAIYDKNSTELHQILPVRKAISVNTQVSSQCPPATLSPHTSISKTPTMKSITSFFQPVASTSMLTSFTSEGTTKMNDFVTPSKYCNLKSHVRSPCKTLSENDVTPIQNGVSYPSPVGKENDTKCGPMKRKLELTTSSTKSSKSPMSNSSVKKSHQNPAKRRHSTPNDAKNNLNEKSSIKRYFRASLPLDNFTEK